MKRQKIAPCQSAAGICFDGKAWQTKPWGKTQYIGAVPGKSIVEGIDWGWIDDIKQAICLSFYWQRRFRSDMRASGIPFQRQPIPADESQ